MSITCYLGLGSNLGDPVRQVLAGVEAISQLRQCQVIQTSSLYRSLPMGPQDQPDYINAVVALKTTLGCYELLRNMQAIELAQGRERKDERWGARTLDIDILFYGNTLIDEPDLKVPHYGIREREFVLVPMAEIAPGWKMPEGETMAELAAIIPQNNLQKLAN